MQKLTGKSKDLGGGIVVRRVLPQVACKHIGPFVFFDEMGPVDFAPGAGFDVRPHPHIGLSTITYLYEGAIRHRDSLGYVKDIVPGEINWMTAGRGIVHSERTPPETRAAGGRTHGIQAWVALPKTHESCEPRFDHYPAANFEAFVHQGHRLVLIAGEAFGRRSPVAFPAPILYAHLELCLGRPFELKARPDEEVAVYVVRGELSLSGQVLRPGQLGRLEAEAAVQLEAVGGAPVTAMILGGAPLDAKRYLYWNFVASSPAAIEAAKQAWRLDRFAKVPGEHERIPLPE